MKRARYIALAGLLGVLATAVSACTPPICFGPALEIQDVTWTRAQGEWDVFGEVEGILYHRNCGSTVGIVEIVGSFYEANGAVTKHSTWLYDVRPNERRRWQIVYVDDPRFVRVEVAWKAW